MSQDQALLAQLMQKLCLGEPAALGELYDLTVDTLHGLALRLVRNSADAEDVLCEVFKQVWERPRQYQAERGPVIAWLLVIVRTRAFDLIRKRRESLSLDTVPEHYRESSGEVEQSLDLLQSLQEKSALRAALLQLNTVQRRMLDLAFFQDMSHQEIADSTGMALGTVKSHIRRGQQALERILSKDGFCYE